MWILSRGHKHVLLFPSDYLKLPLEAGERPLPSLSTGTTAGHQWVHMCSKHSLEDACHHRLPGCKSLKNIWILLVFFTEHFFFFLLPRRCVLCKEWPVILAWSCLPPSSVLNMQQITALTACSLSPGTLWSTKISLLLWEVVIAHRGTDIVGLCVGGCRRFHHTPPKCFDAKNTGYSARTQNKVLIHIPNGRKLENTLRERSQTQKDPLGDSQWKK